MAGQMGQLHFGIGPADRAEVRVAWPDGQIDEWMSADAGERAIVIRAAN